MDQGTKLVCAIYLLSTISIVAFANFNCGLPKLAKPKTRMTSQHYQILITGNPRSYTPEETYTVSIESSPVPPNRAFREFMLALENLDKTSSVGELHLADSLTKFSKECPNVIIHTNALLKKKIEVRWRAPKEGSGCVVFKGTVVESSDIWFSEEGDLAKVLCEETTDSSETQPEVLEECCACQEAKYEVVFEGLWSRNTFPNHFPDDEWKTRFSDIVGASHSNEFNLWTYENSPASEGLKELAEQANTKIIEDQLKQANTAIRTIIKAKGLSYPNTTGRTYATFRVDNQRHLMSLVASIVPSPDWFVGVSNYELCTKECDWLTYQEFNLKPWDAGTDDGISYTSPDQPSNMGHPVRQILSNSPNDPESPFFDPDGESVKPLAKIYITRQKVYDKECEARQEEGSETQDGCPDGECGDAESGVDRSECPFRSAEACEFTSWSDWSNCSISCVRTRDRDYKLQECKDYCNSRSDIPDLQENEKCADCADEYEELRKKGKCEYSLWTECVDGSKSRTRMPSIYNEDICNQLAEIEVVGCMQNEEVEEKAKRHTPQSRSQVVSPNVLGEGYPVPVINCEVSEWSKWGICDPNNGTCGRGVQTKSRRIVQHNLNGGKPCPRRLMKRRPCNKKCLGEKRRHNTDEYTQYSDPLLPTWGPGDTARDLVPLDCGKAEWGSWSACSKSCGVGTQSRMRNAQFYSNMHLNRQNCPLQSETRICYLRPCKY